jgi:hypothetical protein
LVSARRAGIRRLHIELRLDKFVARVERVLERRTTTDSNQSLAPHAERERSADEL